MFVNEKVLQDGDIPFLLQKIVIISTRPAIESQELTRVVMQPVNAHVLVCLGGLEERADLLERGLACSLHLISILVQVQQHTHEVRMDLQRITPGK